MASFDQGPILATLPIWLLSEYASDRPNDQKEGAKRMRETLICPLLSGPISILELATKEEWNGKEAQA